MVQTDRAMTHLFHARRYVAQLGVYPTLIRRLLNVLEWFHNTLQLKLNRMTQQIHLNN